MAMEDSLCIAQSAKQAEPEKPSEPKSVVSHSDRDAVTGRTRCVGEGIEKD